MPCVQKCLQLLRKTSIRRQSAANLFQRAEGRPQCLFGQRCYRHNLAHWREYDHPNHPFLGMFHPEHPPPAEAKDLESSAAGSTSKRPRRETPVIIDVDAEVIDVDADESVVARTNDQPQRPTSSPRLAYRLNTLDEEWVRANRVDSAANAHTVSLRDLLSDFELEDCLELHLHNFMIDLDWICDECPALVRYIRILDTHRKLVLIHGDGVAPTSAAATSAAARGASSRIVCLQPNCERFGTHHSKAILIVRRESLTVHITTANFIFSDWKNKTNGVWTGEFVLKQGGGSGSGEGATAAAAAAAAAASGAGGSSGGSGGSGDFGEDLLAYYVALKALGKNPPSHYERHAGDWDLLNFDFLRRYDYSSAAHVRLIASVPGRHTGDSLHRWGHMRVRTILSKQPLPPRDAILVWQFSSLSSCGKNTKWVEELRRSFAPLGVGPRPLQTRPPQLCVIYPTEAQIAESLEGWAAGCSLPCNEQNAHLLEARLKVRLAPLTIRDRLSWPGHMHGPVFSSVFSSVLYHFAAPLPPPRPPTPGPPRWRQACRWGTPVRVEGQRERRRRLRPLLVDAASQVVGNVQPVGPIGLLVPAEQLQLVTGRVGRLAEEGNVALHQIVRARRADSPGVDAGC